MSLNHSKQKPTIIRRISASVRFHEEETEQKPQVEIEDRYKPDFSVPSFTRAKKIFKIVCYVNIAVSSCT